MSMMYHHDCIIVYIVSLYTNVKELYYISLYDVSMMVISIYDVYLLVSKF